MISPAAAACPGGAGVTAEVTCQARSTENDPPVTPFPAGPCPPTPARGKRQKTARENGLSFQRVEGAQSSA
jgi:hypothetical protein